jgi:phosphoribosylglycinamide formyltransferase-1
LRSQPLRIGFLASRNGSSFRAIVEAVAAGSLAVEPGLLVSNNRSSGALAFAESCAIPSLVLPTQTDPDAADHRLSAAMTGAGVELIVLSGYLRHLGPATLATFRNRIINIHPGPLPQFGGEGMYGRRVHEAVIAAGVAASGVTIHLVDEVYDHGEVLARWDVPLDPGETIDSLEARVTALEPQLFVETLGRIVAGDLVLPS